MKKYAIICGSRTGSTYLCNLLNSTNRCGRPQEYFNPDLINSFKQQVGLTPEANTRTYIDKLINQRSSPNFVFGIKIVGFNQLEFFNTSGLKLEYYIWLNREDSILQAISRYIAFTTNGWHRKTQHPPYSYNGIKWCLEEIVKENTFYTDFFSRTPHLKISYENDILESPQQTITCILNYLGITVEEVPQKLMNPESTNDVNLKWKVQFIQDEKIRTQII